MEAAEAQDTAHLFDGNRLEEPEVAPQASTEASGPFDGVFDGNRLEEPEMAPQVSTEASGPFDGVFDGNRQDRKSVV